MSQGYISKPPGILATARNPDGTPAYSIGPATLVTLPTGEVITILECQFRGLVKRDPGFAGRYYEVDPQAMKTPKLSDALLDAERKIADYQEGMPAGSSGKLYAELEDVKSAIRKLRRQLDTLLP